MKTVRVLLYRFLGRGAGVLLYRFLGRGAVGRQHLFPFLLLCCMVSQAQIHKITRSDSTISRSYNLNPVVVTGSGHHQRLKSTATPVHVLSAQEIREQGISTFDGALVRMMPQLPAPQRSGQQIYSDPHQRSETLWRHLQQYRPQPYQYGACQTYRGTRWRRLVTLRL